MPAPLDLQALRSDLAFVERQLVRHPDPDDTIRLMWEQRRHAIQEELAQIDSPENRYAQVALLFKGPPVIGSSDIQLDFTAKVLEHYQAVVGALVAEQAGAEIGTRGKLPRSWTSKLYVRDMVRGSVGFLLEEPVPRQAQLLDSALKEGVARASRILGDLSGANSSAAEETMAALHPRAVGALKHLAKVLKDAGAETKIVSDEGELTLGLESTAILHSRLTELEIAERREERTGQILGIIPDHRQFEFRPESGGPILYGPVSEALDARYLADPNFARSIILGPGLAKFIVLSTTRSGKVQREDWILEDFAPEPFARIDFGALFPEAGN